MPPLLEFILPVVPPMFVFVIVTSFIITLLFVNKKQHQRFLKKAAQLKLYYEEQLSKLQLEVQEETFQHISLELHDNVGHFLALAKLHLTTFNATLPIRATEKIESAALLITRSLDEIRNLSSSLNSENIKSNGLIKTVQEQIDQLNKAGQYTIYFTILGTTCYLDELKEIVLFRIMQECLNNIVKHSKADIIHIKLHYDEQTLLLSIQDNGIGFIVEPSIRDASRNSSGLKNIIKRSFFINAVPEIWSRPHEGTIINITTPY